MLPPPSGERGDFVVAHLLLSVLVELIAAALTVAFVVYGACRGWAWDGEIRRAVIRLHARGLLVAAPLVLVIAGFDLFNVAAIGGYVVALASVVCVLDSIFPWGRYPCGLVERVQAWMSEAAQTTRLTEEER